MTKNSEEMCKLGKDITKLYEQLLECQKDFVVSYDMMDELVYNAYVRAEFFKIMEKRDRG